MNQNSYNSNSPGFDQPQPPQSPVIHQPPQEMSIQEMEDLKQKYLDEMKCLINSEYRDEIKIAELKQNFNESDEFIKSSVENLIPIPSESEGIPENMSDVPFVDNSPPLDVSKDQFEDFSDSNDEFSSTDDDSFSIDNIDYVEASPPDSELVSSEVMEIVIPEEFTDELALITYPPEYDDNLQFDIESDLKEIEFLLYQGKDSSLKDSIDQKDLANLDDNFVDPIPEMFTNEHTPGYSSPLIFDVYDDDFLEFESDADNVFDDPFDSKEEKIKEVDVLPSTNNEDKDFDPPFYDPLFFKDVPKSKMLLPFSSENKEKVFKPGIYTSEK
nr:hypothetical protein [Tanacetum cinerariifolium]